MGSWWHRYQTVLQSRGSLEYLSVAKKHYFSLLFEYSGPSVFEYSPPLDQKYGGRLHLYWTCTVLSLFPKQYSMVPTDPTYTLHQVLIYHLNHKAGWLNNHRFYTRDLIIPRFEMGMILEFHRPTDNTCFLNVSVCPTKQAFSHMNFWFY